MRKLRFVLLPLFLFFVLLTTIQAQDSPQSANQQKAFEALLQSLQALQADADSIPALLKQIETNEAQNQAELQALQKQISDLQTSLAQAGQRKAQIEKRLQSLNMGKSLLQGLTTSPALQAPAADPVPVEKKAETAQPPVGTSSNLFSEKIQPIFLNNCIGCHGPKQQMAKLDLSTPEGIRKGGQKGSIIVPGKAKESPLYLALTGEVLPRMPLSMDPLPAEQIKLFEEWINAGAPFEPTAQTAVSQLIEQATASITVTIAPPADSKVDFSKEVFPIFEAKCLGCHGEKKQAAQLRLDSKTVVEKGGLSGKAIAPGKAGESLLFQRINGVGGKPHMPFKGDKLPQAEIDRIRDWINQGAEWPEGVGTAQASINKHWAYVKPERPALPSVKNREWIKNPIDTFILARLEKEGLAPSPEASKETLIRRVSLDLTGLPPTPKEVREFVADTSPDAYERLVDRLLESPHYGERWGKQWLDLARYADSNGYEKDARRTMWPYRDWVINALNKNQPFDRFVVEQMAGDLLPNPSRDQLIATGYHRNSMINEEGGVDQEEYRINAVLDRTNNTGTVFLGSTVACAQCHNHKYDPITQKNYYQLVAFFNNTTAEVKAHSSYEAVSSGPFIEFPTPEQKAVLDRVRPELDLLQSLFESDTQEVAERRRRWEQAVLAANDPKAASEPLAADAVSVSATTTVPGNLLSLIKKPEAERTKDAIASIQRHYRNIAPEFHSLRQRINELREQLPKNVETTLYLRELDQPRETRVFMGGSFLTPGEKVEPNVPQVLPPLPADAPRNRLGLARWLISRDNPLTARVTVNRFWEQYFGFGIVKTTEDFGIQGEKPVHPELLDWLAVEFMENGWNQKALHRLIVTSAVYRQASNITPEGLERDPDNRLLARGPRVRLEAETIRDNALAASGLLSPKIGGPSVFPFQPEGVWIMPYSSERWILSQGEDRYRRGVYIHRRRTAPYPSFKAFDAPSREFTCTRRPRTNTPLQALVTLNDPVFFEAAQSMARRILMEAEPECEKRIDYAFELCTARIPDEKERQRVKELYDRQLENFKKDTDAAKKVACEGTSPPPESMDMSELAAWTMVSNVLLNLDETITKG